MPLWHHWAFWNMGIWKWLHRVVMGVKNKNAWMFFRSVSYHPLFFSQKFKTCNYLSNATHGSDVRLFERSNVSIQIVQGSKKKVAPIFLKMVAYCSSSYRKSVINYAYGDEPFFHRISVTSHFRLCKLFFFWILSSTWTICHHFQENRSNFFFNPCTIWILTFDLFRSLNVGTMSRIEKIITFLEKLLNNIQVLLIFDPPL